MPNITRFQFTDFEPYLIIGQNLKDWRHPNVQFLAETPYPRESVGLQCESIEIAQKLIKNSPTMLRDRKTGIPEFPSHPIFIPMPEFVFMRCRRYFDYSKYDIGKSLEVRDLQRWGVLRPWLQSNLTGDITVSIWADWKRFSFANDEDYILMKMMFK